MNDRTSPLLALRDELFAAGARQQRYEHESINLIASDNAIPGWRALTRPYSGDMIQEGIVGNRPFAGADIHNELEGLAAEIACKVYGVDHAILQSHSCSQANQAVYHGFLEPSDRVLALQFRAGGHLTHGMRRNFSGRHYEFEFFGVGEDGRIDYEAARRIAKAYRPKLVVCGSSSYPWDYDVAELRSICDEVGAILHLDLSHEAGLIAGGAFQCDLQLADVVTMSMDKTLRGPHGALILCRAEHARRMDSAVHPGTQSSFPIRRFTDGATALLESQTKLFAEYTHRCIDLAQIISERFLAVHPAAIVGGGTAKHYVLLNTSETFGIDGRTAEATLEKLGIMSSRQSLPTDGSNRMSDAGGLRLGTAWLASCGYEKADVLDLSELVLDALAGRKVGLDAVQALITQERPRDIRRAKHVDWTLNESRKSL